MMASGWQETAPANSAVIVRLDRTIQHSATFGFSRGACDYWIPAFAGMTNSRHVEQKNDGGLNR
jgi:hypothetical protein